MDGVDPSLRHYPYSVVSYGPQRCERARLNRNSVLVPMTSITWRKGTLGANGGLREGRQTVEAREAACVEAKRNDLSEILAYCAKAEMVPALVAVAEHEVAAGSLSRRLPDVAGMVIRSLTSSPLPRKLLGAKNKKSAPETAARLWRHRFWAAPTRSFGPRPNSYKLFPETTSPSLPIFLRRALIGTTSPADAAGSAAAISRHLS
jgi:hypothetical protein